MAYFDKPADRLSLPEALTLAVIPRDPMRHLRGTTGLLNRRLTASRDRLYARWLQRHPKDEALKPLFALPMTIRPLSDLPFEAPHAVDQLLQARSVAGVSKSRVVKTLELGLQHIVERHVARYIARNASAILVDTRDLSVKALIGSAHHANMDISRQVNGTLASRSPGSTLKPFIYALGFDQGVLHPQTVLRDIPTTSVHSPPRISTVVSLVPSRRPRRSTAAETTPPAPGHGRSDERPLEVKLVE